MSNETPGERGHWKDRLNDLDRLPDDAWTGREATWDDLHERLHQKEKINRHRRYPLYWVAAASALLIIGIPVSIRIVHERQRGAEATSSISKTTSSPAPAGSIKPVVSSPRQAVGQAIGAALGQATVKRGDVVTKAHSNEPTRIIQDTSAATMAPFARTGTPVSGTEPPVRGTEPPASARTFVAAVVPPTPRKLAVVSINELGMDEEEQPGRSRKTDRYLQIKLINDQAYTETASEDSRQQSGRLGIHIHR